MPFQLSPNVNVSEIDLTAIVPSVATTNAGYCGFFDWGPVDQIVLIDSEENLRTLYGKPSDANYKYWYSAANFLGYGNSLQVVRAGGATNAADQTATLIRNSNHREELATTDTEVIGSANDWIAKYPGALGNSLKVSVCGSALTGVGAGTTFNGWAYKNYFEEIAGTSDYAAIRSGSSDELHVAVIDEDGLWTGQTGYVLEKFAFVSLARDAKNSDGSSNYIADVINNQSKYIWFAGGNNFTTDFTNATNTVANTTFGQTGAIDYSLTGGVDATPTSAGTIASLGTTSGYNLFEDADTVDVSLLIGGPIAASEALLLSDMADARKDCVAFVSPNITVTKDYVEQYAEAVTYRNTVGSSSYTVMDSGYKYQYDKYNDTYRWIPLNADIAGLCARTDTLFDPWYSPAGFNRGQIRGAVKLAFNPTLSYRDELYKRGINPVCSFPGDGIVLYGDKTLQAKPSAFDRINVRRLFIVLEKAIATAAKYQLFEFNDSVTQTQFKNLVVPFLREVRSRRGITDFLVVCDSTVNTPEVIDRNEFVANIFIKPNRSINFIQLNFIATRTGAAFEEIASGRNF